MNPECPYCGVAQDPPPQRKRKCRDCAQTIYIQREGDRRTLITKQEHDKLQRKARDQHWRELSLQVQRAMKTRDWQAASQAYRSQARILFAEGRDHQRVLDEAFRCDLRQMQEAGIKQVEVSTSQDERVCDGCQAVDGKKIAVADALESMPLPGEGCEMCRCVYIAVFDYTKQPVGSGGTMRPNPSAGGGCASLIALGLMVAVLVVLAFVL